MRAFTYFLSVIICSFYLSCSKDSHQLPLEFYETLQNSQDWDSQQASQACRIFERLAKDTINMSEEQKMYFLLKWIYVKDKEGNSSIDLQNAKRVTDYYEENGPDSLLMESYYYMGRAYRDKNDGPRSIHWYAKAQHIAEKNSSLVHNIVYTKICLHMGEMYNEMFLAEKAINTYRKALKGDSCEHLLYIYYYMAVSFKNLGMQDSTLYYLKKAYDTPDLSERAKMDLGYCQLATLYDMDESDSTIQKEIERRAKGILDYDESQDGKQYKFIYQYIKGRHYLYLNRTDSAEYYFKKLLRSSSLDYRNKGVRHLLRIAIQKQNLNDVEKYGQLYIKVSDSMYIENETAKTAQVEQLFNYQLATEEKLEAERQKLAWQHRAWIITLLSICIVGGGIYLYRYRRRKQSLIMRKMDADLVKYKELEAQLKATLNVERQSMEMLRNTLDTEKQENDKLKEGLKTHERNIERLNAKIAALEESYKQLVDNVPRLTEHLQCKQGKMNTTTWQKVKCAMDAKYPEMAQNIERQCPWISDTDLMMVYLLCMEVRNARVAELLNISPQNLNGHKTRLYARVSNNKDANTIESNLFIKSLRGTDYSLIG